MKKLISILLACTLLLALFVPAMAAEETYPTIYIEGQGIGIYRPDGTKVWEMDDISALEQYVCRGELAQKGGVFKVLLQKPTNLVTIEDYFIQLTNIPSILGLSPDQMIKATVR